MTAAAIAVIGGALLLFLSGFDTLNNLQTVDLREQLAQSLGSARGLGLTVDELIGWMHVATLVTGAAAAAAAVLGWFALQRHRGARIGLAAVAAVLLVCAPLAGGVLAAFVVVAIAMLWSGPARDWYAGRPVRTAAGPSAGPSAPGVEHRVGSDPAPGSGSVPEGYDIWTGRSQEPSGPPSSSSPPPTEGFGDRPTAAPVFGPDSRAPQQPSAYPGSAGPRPLVAARVPQPVRHPAPGAQGCEGADRRPGPVVAASVLTWGFAGAIALVFLLVVGVLVADPQGLVARVEASAQWRGTGMPSSMILPMLWVSVPIYLGWSLGACLLAWFAWRGRSWARVLLVVSAIAVMVLGLFALPLSVPHLLASATVVGLLLSGSANRWYARTSQPGPGHPPGPTAPRPPRAW